MCAKQSDQGDQLLTPMQILTVQIERMSYGAAAIARYEGFVIFVHGHATPGDLAKVQLTKKSKNYWDAQLLEVLAPSPQRIQPPCPYFGECGGCQWQHIAYEQQLKEKRNIVLHQISRSTQISSDKLLSLTSVLPSPQQFGYRNRVQIRGNENNIGFFKSGSRQLVPIDDCLLLEEPLRSKWTQFQGSTEHHHIAQRSSEDFFKVEWTLNDDHSIKQSVNAPHAAEGFTQVNTLQNTQMVSIVTAHAKECAKQNKLKNKDQHTTLLDLYSGTGNLSQQIIDDFQAITCVEGFLDKKFLEQQKLIKNAKRNFIASDVRKFLEKMKTPKAHCIIADPPREGLGKAAALIAAIKAETVILVSCDPSTLARDLTHFISSSTISPERYEIEHLYILDMFPQTFHIESIVVLRFKSSMDH